MAIWQDLVTADGFTGGYQTVSDSLANFEDHNGLKSQEFTDRPGGYSSIWDGRIGNKTMLA